MTTHLPQENPMTTPPTEQQLASIALAVASSFDQTEPAKDRQARWENAAWAAGRTVDRNALAVYMAVADAEQQALAEDWGRAAAASDAEIRSLRTELSAFETLAPQQCPAGLHADWLVDSEYAHTCPWCQIEGLRAQLVDQAATDTVAQRAAKAISAMGDDLRAMTSERNRYRNAWHNACTRAVDARSDAELAEAASTPSVAPLPASQPPEVPTEPETATEAPEGRVGDSGAEVVGGTR